MRRRLPPLTTLEGFEAAARLGSFSAAAEALGLTQSAISHQIRMLEQALGQPLFRRLHRKIVLTDAGEDFHHSVIDTLSVLRDGVGRLEPYRKPGSVVVYCDSALANAWLGPRLVDLRKAHPKIDIWLDTSNRAVDFARDEVDILIRRQGDERPPQGVGDLNSSVLFGDMLRPLATPKLARILRKGSLLANMRAATLLHEEGFDGWPAWFDKVGPNHRLDAGHRLDGDHRLEGQPDWLTRGPNFSDAYVMLQSAAAGLGVALATDIIAAPFLANGTLTWISAVRIPAPAAYIATASEDGFTDPDIRQTFDWIVAEAQMFDSGPRTRRSGPA